MKVDFKKELKQFYTASTKDIQIVNLPKTTYITIDGYGDPNKEKLFQEAIETLYNLSYTLKFALKAKIDYTVMPLEGLWWTDKKSNFNILDKSNWNWTLMIMQPKLVNAKLLEDAKETVAKKKSLNLLPKVSLNDFNEGLSVQIMHLGPYSTEQSTIEKLHTFIKEKHYKFNGKHHEIYLSNPGRTAPEKIKTILRQPIAK